MQLIPYIGTEKVRSDQFSIVVDPDDSERVTKYVERAQAVAQVDSQASFALATQVAGQLKDIITEIYQAKRSAKRPFEAVEHAIDNKAKEVSLPLEAENKRILDLLSNYVARIEAAQRAEAKRKEEERKAEQARTAMLREQAERAEAQARLAPSNNMSTSVNLRLEAERARAAAEEAALDQALAVEVAQFEHNRPKVSPLAGAGRVNHPWEFRIVDLKKLIDSGHQRLVRVQLDKLACQDLVRQLTERQPADFIPEIPGLEISKGVSVSVRPSA